jgi:hypothetical protein
VLFQDMAKKQKKAADLNNQPPSGHFNLSALLPSFLSKKTRKSLRLCVFA